MEMKKELWESLSFYKEDKAFCKGLTERSKREEDTIVAGWKACSVTYQAENKEKKTIY